MLFNSYIFLLFFLPVTWLGFIKLLKIGAHNVTLYLLGVSLCFYAIWDWHNLFVLIPSIFINYIFGEILKKSPNKIILIFSILANIALLVYYKYFYFLVSIVTNAPVAINASASLPLGISFFTFTQITYLVDMYKKQTDKASFADYALFVTYFPHLISGPLLHHKEMISQFRWNKSFNQALEFYGVGLGFLILGLVKKVIIADRLGIIADPVFLSPDNYSMIDTWKGVLAYTFQLYFDFSGYSDMAIGISKLFHINLPINFNSPYKATSIIDFWRRWHMTLSKFLKDYIYIPLGGNKYGNFNKLRNIFIVMLICGIWHGAGYTFLLWGLWHGTFLILNNLWRIYVSRPFIRHHLISSACSWAMTFGIVVLGWVIFRAQTLSDALLIFQIMTVGHVGSFTLDSNWILIFIAFLLSTLGPNTQELLDWEYLPDAGYISRIRWKPTYHWALILSCLAGYTLVRIKPISPFLYWQF